MIETVFKKLALLPISDILMVMMGMALLATLRANAEPTPDPFNEAVKECGERISKQIDSHTRPV